MTQSRSPLLLTAIAFWTIALLALIPLARVQASPPGWDAKSYFHFLHVVQHGEDPYQSSIAEQNLYRAHLRGQIPPPVRIQCVDEPCPYVYSPLSLPLLHLAASFPSPLPTLAFLTLYLLGAVATPILLLHATEPGPERTLFTLLAPAALFFPGLLLDFVLFSGNIAYILYALAFAAAVLGWKRHRWLPFYLAVLLASFVKPPLLTLLAIPLLSGNRTVRGTLLTATAGLGLFAAQPLLFPRDFPLYLQVVDRLFRDAADFGFSPAGLLATLLTHIHHPYSPWTTLAYLSYVTPIAATLWILRRRYLLGCFPLHAWLPVLLLGTLLLNPRNKEYDVAAFTLPMALILWRLVHRYQPHSLPRTALLTTLLLLTLKLLADATTLQLTYALLTPTLFTLGAHHLLTTHPTPKLLPASTSSGRFTLRQIS